MLDRISRALRPWPHHPIDDEYGIETSRKTLRLRLRTGDRIVDQANVGYVGSQPSIIRKCLSLLPSCAGATFVDLGCGKGRVLAVATEFPFASISGIELSGALCDRAERNFRRLTARFPDRIRPRILKGDATGPRLPEAGVAVLFLYNSFKGPLVARLVAHLTAQLARTPELTLFLVYYNPVQAVMFDDCAAFDRFHAARYDFEASERDTSPFGNQHDSVVIWQSSATPIAAPLPDAGRDVRVLVPDFAATVF